MTNIIFDIETNGIDINTVDKIWCISVCTLDVEGVKTPIFRTFSDYHNQPNRSIAVFKQILEDSFAISKLTFIGHNIIAYDLPVLAKLLFKCPVSELYKRFNIIDTLVVSRVLNPDRNGHSIEDWAARFGGEQKVQQEQWQVFDPNMITRCESDVRLNYKILKALQTEGKFRELPPYLAMEMRFAQLCYHIQENGMYLDIPKCEEYIKMLTKSIAELDKQIEPCIPDTIKPHTPLVNIYKKNGELKQAAQDFIETGNPYEIEGNTMIRYIRQKACLGDSKTLKSYLLSIGWKPSQDPDKWNYKTEKSGYGKLVKVKDKDGKYIRTSPKLPKEDHELEELMSISPLFKPIAQRMQQRHRLSVIEGYLKNQVDGKLASKINPCRCNTMRVSHSVLANVPRKESYFGQEMRSLFQATPGKVLVGADVDGLEACMLANLLGDKEFIQFIKDNDYKYHKYFQKVLVDFIDGYDKIKSFDFAFIYGGGDEKLGSLCNKKKGNNIEIGKQVRAYAQKNVPGLDNLQKRLESEFTKYKGIFGVDGRWLPVRKKSALINTACQGDGAIVSKYWTCKTIAELEKRGIPHKLVMYMHDELIIETEPQYAAQVGETLANSMTAVSKYLNLKIELSASFRVGNTWGDCH